MSLQNPIFLLALLLIPAGILAARLAKARRRKFAVRLPTAGTLATLIPRESPVKRAIPGALLAAAVASLAFALAKPEVTVSVPVERASVMLVTDASGSMRATDVAPSRLDAARSAVGSFLSEVPEAMRVGLISYSSTVETLQAPTTDRAAVRDSASTISANGGTATGDALAEAVQRLKNDGGDDMPPSAILLLSDGMTSAGVDPLGVAQTAKQAGISISTVALGTPDGTVTLQPGITRAVPPDPETLRQIAEISGGRAFTVDDAGELDQVYEKMGSQLGTRPEQREATAGFAGLGALLLGAAVFALMRRRDRLT
ncbi:MAG: VWA domain-containing protein [Solirubrobacteraceae bacterium]|nr:VWA domain-containing protein [Solirubrobacteraceae bacterium]